MFDKSINSPFGMLSTKELPASGMLQVTNKSIQGNHEKDSFLVKLVSSMATNHKLDEQTSTTIPSELYKDIIDTDDINHIIKQLSMGTPTNIVTNTDGNQTQLNPEVNQDIHRVEFTNPIINNNPNGKTSTKPIETSTLLENALLNKQELKPLDGSNSNLLSDAQNKAISFSGKLTTTENNTKMNEQKVLDIIDRPSTHEEATESRIKESILQPSKLAERQVLESHTEANADTLILRPGINKDIVEEQITVPSENNLNKNKKTTKITTNQNYVPTIEKEGSNTIPDAYKILNLNTSSHPEESAEDKIFEKLKGQHQGKALSANTGKNTQAQQSLAQAHIENNESPIVFDVSTNTTEVKAAKTLENSTLINNNAANNVEADMPVNTSSDNSFFNNQGIDSPYEFQISSVNAKHNTESEKIFNNTLSQINDSNNPMGTLANDVADNIIQNAKLYMQGGKSEIKMQLNPPELGTLKLEFAFEDDILETKITVERSTVKDVIEKDIPRLRELISNSDIDVGTLDVSLQDKENGRMDFMNKDFHSDSKSKGAQDFSNHENEFYEDNMDEETMANNTESAQVNYLV